MFFVFLILILSAFRFIKIFEFEDSASPAQQLTMKGVWASDHVGYHCDRLAIASCNPSQKSPSPTLIANYEGEEGDERGIGIFDYINKSEII